MDQKSKILELVNAELNLCDPAETPFVCSMYATQKDFVVQQVYDYVMKQNMNISDAILEVEAGFNSNF